MKKIYETREWAGHGKQNYYWNEYRYNEDEETVEKYKCNRHKFFDGHENEWIESERLQDSWGIEDPNMPEWINKYL